MNPGKKHLLAAMLAASFGVAHADGVFVDAANAADMVYDDARGIMYVTNGTGVLRYDVLHNAMLPPIALGAGNLVGVDLSPDGHTLAVADAGQYDGKSMLHLVNLDTLTDSPATVLASTYGEYGLFDVHYAHDGTLLVTASYGGSGWVPLRHFDPTTTTWTNVVLPVSIGQLITQNTMLASSADRRTIGLGESNISDGRWGVYDAAVDHFDSRDGYQNGTSMFNYDVGVSNDGTQFAIQGYSNSHPATYVYDSSYRLLTSFSSSNSAAVPTHVAYHPTEPKLFAPTLGTTLVTVYDTNTFQAIGSYDFIDTFKSIGAGFQQGHTRVSNDGSLLMVSVTGGVRYLRLYAPLSVQPVTATSSGGRTQIALKGAVGDHGTIAYATDSEPAHGKAFVDGSTLTYVPAVGFSGTDTFTYAAYYGKAKLTSTVTVTVTANNSAYSPVVSFSTLPVLRSTTSAPNRTGVPGDFTGDGTSDLLWFNPTTSQVGYWTMTAATTHDAGKAAPVTRQGTTIYNVTPGYFVGATGDFNGDGFADLVFTSANRDLWLWTNDQHGHWSSSLIGSYPANWQLVGAADIDGDGIDDLLWLDPSDCQFAYWLMNGNVRKSYRIAPVTCGYYPVGVGYYTSSGTASVLWSSAANDLYVWDAQGGGFSSHNLTNAMTQLGTGNVDTRYIWSFGGGWAGQGMGVEWFDPAARAGFGALLSRPTTSSTTTMPTWAGTAWVDKPESGGYLLRNGYNRSALYVLDRVRGKIGTSGMLVDSGASYSGVAPIPMGQTWTYPAGWYVIGAPSNGAAPLPWR